MQKIFIETIFHVLDVDMSESKIMGFNSLDLFCQSVGRDVCKCVNVKARFHITGTTL